MAELAEPWVTAWCECESCGREFVNVRPLVMRASVLECLSCGEMAAFDNGPIWPDIDAEAAHG